MQTGTHCLYDTSILCVCVCRRKERKNATRVYSVRTINHKVYALMAERQCEVMSTISEINALSGR